MRRQVQNLDDSVARILNPGFEENCEITSPMVTKTSVLYHHANIVYYVLLSTKSNTSSSFVTSCQRLSSYKFLEPEKIILHTNTDVVGAYWKSIQERSVPWEKSTKLKEFLSLLEWRLNALSMKQIIRNYGYLKNMVGQYLTLTWLWSMEQGGEKNRKYLPAFFLLRVIVVRST